jgi:hypothetical protein
MAKEKEQETRWEQWSVAVFAWGFRLEHPWQWKDWTKAFRLGSVSKAYRSVRLLVIQWGYPTAHPWQQRGKTKAMGKAPAWGTEEWGSASAERWE